MSVGLKKFSKDFRDNILKRNLKTPPEIRDGIIRATSRDYYNSLVNDLGEHTVLTENNVVNPGDIVNDSKTYRSRNLKLNLPEPDNSNVGEDTNIFTSPVIKSANILDIAGKLRDELLNKNKTPNINDPSESDDAGTGYLFSQIVNSIGKIAVINDYTVPNAPSISSQSNISSEQERILQLQLNKSLPSRIDYFESTLNLLKNAYGGNANTPYIKNGQLVSGYQAQEYTPSDFITGGAATQPYGTLLKLYSDDPAKLLENGNLPLPNDTILANIAALELKFNFETRIKRAVERETLGRTYLDEAMTNPLAAINILKDPKNNLFEKNYEITIPANPIGKAAQMLGEITGVQSPVSLFTNDFFGKYSAPSCFLDESGNNFESNNRSEFSSLVRDILGTSQEKDYDSNVLANTGSGQKFSLFSNIAINKYRPQFNPVYESNIANNVDSALQRVAGVTGFLGFSAGKRPEGAYYLGDKFINPPQFILSDREGDQTKSIHEITRVLTINPNGQQLFEPDVEEFKDYIWYGGGAETFSDIATKSSVTIKPEDSELLTLNVNDRFRDCSLLFKTQRLVEKAGNNGVNSSIDQTKTKFTDGKYTYAKGNAVLKPTKVPVYDSNGKILSYKYEVPGLALVANMNGEIKSVGKRDQDQMYTQGAFCRTWTKVKPYEKISDLVRYKELIRRERNSVIERNGNYSIHPSELNITATNAKKYMLSIENLAWKDTNSYKELPTCEKGENGGRVMWFPPYDLSFSEDSSANWTQHQFLGRPESIYTYNNTERKGSLKFKVIVDHPSVLNLLVQKELSQLPDTAVDEILAAFWAGCVEFDVFEMAALYDQFSIGELDYFKQLIAGINASNTNKDVTKGVATSIPIINKITPSSPNIIETPLIGYNLFFENDVPLRSDKLKPPISDYNERHFGNFYEDYYRPQITTTGGVIAKNAETLKGEIGANNINYNLTIGPQGSGKYDKGELKNKPGLDNINGQYNALIGGLSSITKGNNIEINVNTYASPIGPTSDSGYNDDLAKRRFLSIVKWLGTSIYKNLKTDNGNKADFNSLSYDGDILDEYTYKIGDSTDTIKIINVINKSITSQNIFDQLSTTKHSIKIGETTYEYFTTLEGNVKYIGFKTDAESNFIKTNWSSVSGMSDFTGLTIDNIGSLEPISGRTKADYVIAVSSNEACYSRRAELGIKVTPNRKQADDTKIAQPKQSTKSTLEKYSNVTKRDIAQNILNKLITECDYFDYLTENTPFAFTSLKEKLKYFSPAFHSMTPEGLNGRLTFLNQCLRPGETITDGFNDCDAKNTAFGRPPVCVLRLGDFYNTKVIINSINFTYDTDGLLLDLNPEGIGVQPMIADVTMSITFLGGSGLRKYVDQLQNALSFNFYANTEIYDSRSFANTDPAERDLINQERSFFDGGTLDIQNIVNVADKIAKLSGKNDASNDSTIGKQLRTIQNKGVEDIYNSESNPSGTTFVQDELIAPCILEDDYSTGPFQTYEISYKGLFDDLYSAYGKYVENYYNMINIVDSDDYMLKSTLNRTYVNGDLNDIYGTYSYEPIIDGVNYTDTNKILLSGYKPLEYFYNTSLFNTKGDKLTALDVDGNNIYHKPNLYPMVDTQSLLKGDYRNNLDVIDSYYGSLSGFSGIPLKDNDWSNKFSYLDNMAKEMEKRLNCDLFSMFTYNDGLYEKYYTTFDTKYKKTLREILIKEFKDYYQAKRLELGAPIDNLNEVYKSLTTSLYKMNPLLEGYDGEKNDEGDFVLYEIMPNQKRLINVGESYFGYNIFNNFLKPNGEIMLYANYTGFTDGITGNIGLLAKQVITNDYPSLPKFHVGVGSNANNFHIDDNSYYICNDSTLTYDGTSFNQRMANPNYLNPSDGLYYPLYVYEKINHEFLEFTTRNIGLLKVDNTNIGMSIGLSVDGQKSFFNQLTGVSGATPTVFQNIFDANIMFDDVVYHKLETGPNTSFMNLFTKRLRIGVFNTTLIDQALSTTLINTNIDISYTIELLFFGFLKRLMNNKENIIKQFESYLEANKPKRNGVVDINKISSIKVILNDLFIRLGKNYDIFADYNKMYNDVYAKDVVKPIGDYIYTNLMNKYGFNGPVPPLSNIGSTVSKTLNKGLDADYTLLLRQVSDAPTTVFTVLTDINY